MTEKKAAFGNNFTPEQRAAALKRAAEMRGARAEYLDRVKSGEVAIATALADGKETPVVGRIKAKRLLMALNDNIQKYEQNFGKINLPEAQQPRTATPFNNPEA